jgi:hypothetical protein
MHQPALPNRSVNHPDRQVASPATDNPLPLAMVLPNNYSIVCDEQGWVLYISLPMVTDDIISTVQALYADLNPWLPRRCQLPGLKPVKPEALDQFRDPYGVY